jgi:hypothetical protein
MGRNLGPLNIKDSYEGLVQISGSQLTDGSGSLIPSLDVSASFATTATSASHALNADNAISSSYAVTASFALNAGASTLQEVLDNSNTATGVDIILTGSYQRASGSFSGNVIDNITDTYTGTEKINHVVTLTQAEYNALSPAADTFYVITDAAATMITGSVTDATLTFTKDDATTFPLTVNNVANATSALLAVSASHAVNADNAIIAQTASFLPADTNLNINSITASNASFSSASIGYLQAITGSAKIIGDAFIILNNNTPTERYAGLVVQDSGSTNNTASFEFDGQTNDWFYEYTDDGGATTDHGVAMFGPEYNTKGAPVYNTTNTLVKGDGGHHLLDSSISDDGTLVTIDANVSASGYVSASSFIGDGSQLTGVDAFPYTGSADITGSLNVIGTIQTGGTGHTTTGVQSAAVGGDQINASGERAVGIGGFQNTVSGTDSIVLGGFGMTASGLRSIVAGGIAGNATNIYSAVFGGSSNSAEGIRATILGGDQGFVDSSTNDGVIIGSYQSNIENNAHNSTIINGFQSNINGYSGSAIIGGTGIDADAHHTVYVPNLHLTGSTGGTLTFSDGTTQTTAGGDAFPYTGSAEITGSLGVTGSVDIVASGTNAPFLNSTTQGGVGINAGDGIVAIASGNPNINTSAKVSAIVGATNSTISSTGYQSVVVGGDSHDITSIRTGVFGGYNNNVSSGNSYIFGGSYHDITGGIGQILGGNNTTISGGTYAVTLGGQNNTISAGTYNALVGGSGNTTTHNYSVVIGGQSLSTTKNDEVVVPNLRGVGDVEITGSITVGDALNVNSGTDAMLISIDSNTTATRAGVFAGYQNTASGTDSIVVGGFSNTASGLRSAILSGQSNTASHSYSVVLGGSSLSTTKSEEAVVKHLTTNGTVVQDVKTISIASNTGSLDASLGNIFTITLQNGVDTHLELSNQTAGQTFSLKITNNATAAGTISFDSQFEFEGGTAFTATAATNAVDILTFTTFDGSNVQCVGSKNFS